MKKTLVVIGGGAAGFFAAVNAAEMHPGLEVIILEKSKKLLSKVRISGGGRCNVTNATFEHAELIKNYPRGSRELRQVFARFDVSDTIQWFNERGVELKVEDDGRMFPSSDSSETIVNCLLGAAEKNRVKVECGAEVFSIRKSDNVFELKTREGLLKADYVVCAAGGFAKSGSYDFLRNLGLKIVDPVPSLFTFNLPGDPICQLQGLSVEHASVTAGSYSYQGPVLITHWGLSGPAVLKLSAFAAHELFDLSYNCPVTVNWTGSADLDEVVAALNEIQKSHPRMSPFSRPYEGIPRRLWEHFCSSAGIDPARSWAEISKKSIRLLAARLCEAEYRMQGKTTFKEEFVTCGGIDLKEVDFRTMQSRNISGLYFCGEVLNIDGITGGFNFQAAWSTAFICAKSISA